MHHSHGSRAQRYLRPPPPAGQERAMDKALRRELAAGREDDLLDVLLRFYKDR